MSTAAQNIGSRAAFAIIDPAHEFHGSESSDGVGKEVRPVDEVSGLRTGELDLRAGDDRCADDEPDGEGGSGDVQRRTLGDGRKLRF
jgi:hypothetical protein